jgi:DNA-binding HxlR family transcriptional regulator
MRTYGELCAVARALDVVGDRWSLLVVRELLTLGSARFSDLQRGLPGIAPNLLTGRLRDLEAEGVLARRDAPPPASGGVYVLTERGRDLEGVIRELLKWGAPTVPEAPTDAEFRMHWLSLPARHLLQDRDPRADAFRVRFGDPQDGFDVVGEDAGIRTEPCDPTEEASVTVEGPGPVLVGLLTGAVDLERAKGAGVTTTGDAAALERVLPGH